MNTYFHIYEYDNNLKAWFTIYQLQGKATLSWEDVKIVQGINENKAISKNFEGHFKDKYLKDLFYDKKEN